MAFVTADITISADGFAAGLNLSADKPFGDDPAGSLHRWMFETPEENEAERAALLASDAYIMGRNMFGPGRGAWDLSWTGWWGDEPPYRKPVFVLTHHPRADLPMAGGTTIRFVTGGIEQALEDARKATSDGRIGIAGGAATVNQYLSAGLVDELTLHIAPITIGAGPRLFEGVPPLSLQQISSRAASLATHITYRVNRWSPSVDGV